jgi:hypothetical protein
MASRPEADGGTFSDADDAASAPLASKLRHAGKRMDPRSIRDEIKSDNKFNAHLKAYGLEISTRGFRADAMWLAKQWYNDGVENSLHRCRYSNPAQPNT